MIDFQTASLALLMVIGGVNIINFFFPLTDSRIKFAVSLAIAFAVSFIPAEIGSILLEKLRDAIQIAVAASGLYKVSQVVGQKS